MQANPRRLTLTVAAMAAALVALLVAPGCGPSASSGDDDGSGTVDQPDADGDGISDADEGRPDAIDTDGDGSPDYLDDDSDGDSLPDSLEAGDADLATAPLDSDSDGTPDFRDLDSDGNGLADGSGTETADDLDSDGIGNWADLDDDGDGIVDTVEIGGLAQSPLDSDGDATPDYQDFDSDDDTIADADEGTTDADQDGIPSYLDLDSDGDCIPDALEAGDANLTTPPIDTDGDGAADFVDIDADSDGLSDTREDQNCNGAVDAGETSPVSGDTDGDGVSDLVEVAAGTDPTSAADNPQAHGNFVFVVPYQEPTSPRQDDLDFSTDLKKVDVYVLMDLSGSMSNELDAVRSNMATVLDNLTCPPVGSGNPADCIPELWSGAGTLTYAGRNPYVNTLSMQSDPTRVAAAIPGPDNGSCPTGGCNETQYLATWAAVTGQGSASSGCSGISAFSAAPSCAGKPSGPGGVGYPCFRPDALPVVMLATDEPPSVTTDCPASSVVTAAATAAGAKIVGILGSTTTAGAQLRSDLEALATGTGAVTQAGDPLVFDGADANASSAIEAAIRALSRDVPLDVSAESHDDAGDSVDAVAAFVDHLETLQLGTSQCAGGLSDSDANGDGFPDRYSGVLPGTPVCWRLVAKQNTTVPATSDPQIFRATIEVRGDDVTLLDTRDVYFLVPPDLEGPGVD